MASKLMVAFLLLAIFVMVSVVTAAGDLENFKELQAISLPSAVEAQKKISFIHVQRWGPTFYWYDKGNYVALPYQGTYFNIHGIWTVSRDNNSFVRECNGPVFEADKLTKTALEYMDFYWPSPSRLYTNMLYWSGMWAGFGTCSGLSQSAYFDTSIKLYKQYDFEISLNASGIYPGPTKYKVDDIKKVLDRVVGHRVGISCEKGKYPPGAEEPGDLLYWVYICYSSEHKKVIDCEGFPEGTECTADSIMLPPVACVDSSSTNPAI